MNKDLETEFRKLIKLGHQFMIQLNKVDNLIAISNGDRPGESKAKVVPATVADSGRWSDKLTRNRYSGLTDGEYGLFAVVDEYNRVGDSEFPGLVEHLSAWEQTFMADWMSDEKKAGYSLSEKQETIFEKIAEKLSYNIHHKVHGASTDGQKEDDYLDNDIPF